MIQTRRWLQTLEYFDAANDRAVFIADGNCVDANRNFISGFVVQRAGPLGWMCRLDGAGERVVLVNEFMIRLIIVQQTFFENGSSDDFVAQASGDALRSVAPEHDFFLHVNDTYSYGQALQNVAPGG
jgi:hypothetical protein